MTARRAWLTASLGALVLAGAEAGCGPRAPSSGSTLGATGAVAPFAGTGASGGLPATGGAGGVLATGGLVATGGVTPIGGAMTTGGATGVGGYPGSGGIVSAGGITASGGLMASGGVAATGGVAASGGSVMTGGAVATGGIVASGGTAGITGGVTGLTGGNGGGGSGGATGATGGAGGGAAGASGGTGGGVACPGPACGNTNPENRVCEVNENNEIALGKYRVLNNLWGAGDTVPSDGQCSHSLCDTGAAISWGTEFTWTSGDPISVKSFAAAILGWHWSGVDPATGLPLQLSANRSVITSWSFRVSVNEAASLNVAYDLWLSTTSTPNNLTTPSDEVMVWLYRFNKDDPIGTYQTTVTLADTTWDLYRGDNGGSTQVFSYLRSVNTNCADLDLRDFLDDLVNRGWVDRSKYLISVEAGPEVVMGQGRVDTDTYSCSVE